MQIGDIWTWSVGANSRFPYFGKVVKFTDKTVWIKPIGSKVVEDDGYGQNGFLMPDESTERGKYHGYVNKNVYSGRLKESRGEMYAHIDGCYATKWKGEKECFYTD